MQAMPALPRADIEIETPRRKTILMVECESMPDASQATAADLRHHCLSEGYLELPPDSFFMLASESSFYLWKPGAPDDALPDYSADAKPVLRAYLGWVADMKPWPGRHNMEFGVSGWLGRLASRFSEPDTSEAERMLVDSGLHDLMKGGKVICNP